MVQFRQQDHAHWYHETQRSGNPEIYAAPVTDEHYSANGCNNDNLLNRDNIVVRDIFLLGLADTIPAGLDGPLRQHAAILSASDAMYQALFPLTVEIDRDNTFSLYDRLSSALTVAQVTGVQRLCSHYATRLTPLSSPDASRESNMRLTQITQYARQLASQPTLIDKHALQQLADVGLTDADIIVLSQIIGFVGYQARVVAALSALAGYPTVILPGFPRMEDAPAGLIAPSVVQWQGWLPSKTTHGVISPEPSADEAEITLSALLQYHQQSLIAYSSIITRQHRPQQPDWLALVALVTARINGSRYCLAINKHQLQQASHNALLIEALELGIENALATQSDDPTTHPLIYAVAELTRAPERFSHQHISPLLALGVSNQQIVRIIFDTAAAGWTNRLRQTLGQAV
ncbi:CMD domain-containing protein [Yersinia intermedia]|uniref:CMD domain-containing protein n=1 Tax=Yersinia intermedia TaxID=631 RepID=UPI0022FE43AA|nr:CMD domain-containing protein [Yersinia intermedia]MDA5510566.1 CMD domain-containing protein [Yersinia intermedia]